MTLDEAMATLESLGDPKVRKHNAKFGAGDPQFGVKKGDLRKLAKRIKANHPLALELWQTGNVDARMLAILLIKPKQLSADELDALVRSLTFTHVADWLSNYIIKRHPDKEALRVRWMTDDHPWTARAGWALTSERVAKRPDGLDLAALLDRVESKMGTAHATPQWTMNIVLVEIGIRFAEHRARALAIGDALGVFRDFPTAKGCTSPFAPTWINEMVSRQA